MSPPTSCVLIKKLAEGTAYANTEGTYVETDAINFNGRPIWENADKARFIFYNKPSGSWIVTAMQYKEAILKDPDKNWGGFQGSEATKAMVPWGCGWKDMACIQLSSIKRFSLHKAESSEKGHAYAATEGVYMQDYFSDFNGRSLWINEPLARFAFYNKPSGSWIVTAMQYKEAILKDPDKNWGGFTGSAITQGQYPWDADWAPEWMCLKMGI